MLTGIGGNGRNPSTFGTTPPRGLTIPPRPLSSLAQHFRTFLPMWLLPVLTPFAFSVYVYAVPQKKSSSPTAPAQRLK